VNTDEPLEDSRFWFALRVKPRHEKSASAALQARGYEEFVPLQRAVRQWSDRQKALDLPLFPGYVFCRFRPGERAPILGTPGVRSIVGFGRSPAPVDEQEIAALRRIAEAGLPAEPWKYLREGERVVIAEGPLAGVEGVLLSLKNERRLVVSVTLLQRSVAIEIAGDSVRIAPGAAA
jgi:transcription antitermination factor NusG